MNFLQLIDKALGSLGQSKTQKGFFITLISGLALQLFPDLPQNDIAKIADYVLLIVNGAAQAWMSIGVVHQYVKNKLINKDVIPPSIEKRAKTGEKVLIVKPK